MSTHTKPADFRLKSRSNFSTHKTSDFIAVETAGLFVEPRWVSGVAAADYYLIWQLQHWSTRSGNKQGGRPA